MSISNEEHHRRMQEACDTVEATTRMAVSAELMDTNAELRARAEAAEARCARLEEALRNARPLVEKWCHYQGHMPTVFDQYLGPIDAALSDTGDECYAAGMSRGLLQGRTDMRERAAKLVETSPYRSSQSLKITDAIRALPLTEGKTDD